MARDFGPAVILIRTARLETIAAIYRFVTAGLKGNRGRLAASVADRGVHLPVRTALIAAAAGLFLPGGPAGGATTGLIGESFLGEELLLAGSKGEVVPAILAG
jgi:hypothetical protein